MEELDEVQCPICNMLFRDKRGLTSHARNIHDLGKDEVYNELTSRRNVKDWSLYILFGSVLLSIFGLRR